MNNQTMCVNIKNFQIDNILNKLMITFQMAMIQIAYENMKVVKIFLLEDNMSKFKK